MGGMDNDNGTGVSAVQAAVENAGINNDCSAVACSAPSEPGASPGDGGLARESF